MGEHKTSHCCHWKPRICQIKKGAFSQAPFFFNKNRQSPLLKQENEANYNKRKNAKRRIWMMKKAKIGDIIEFKNGLRGIVEKVNENSVIVDLTYMENYRELDLQERTVVNHKNYKIVEEAAF
jgi:uncharacterized protein YkvS